MGNRFFSIDPATRALRRNRAPQRALRATRTFAISVLASLACGCTLGAQAARDTVSLSLADARSLALRSNPELAATMLDTAVARGELRQAGVLRFNPAGDVLGANGGNGLEAGLSQEVEVFGQRGRRIAAARAGMDRARFSVRNATRRLIGDVDREFYRLAAAVRRAALAEEILALNERLADVAGRQLEGGEISRLDYNLALVELGRSRSRVLAERRQQQQLTIALARLTGLTSVTAIVPLLDSTQHPPLADTARVRARDLLALRQTHAMGTDSLTTLALERRPDVAERVALLRQANAQVSVARREALPNVLIRGVSEPATTGGGRALRPGVGLTFPLFNRNQGQVTARQAAARQAELERIALMARLRAEVASAAATYRSAAAEVEVLEATVLVPARQNRQLLEVAYREGEVGLPVLLLIRNQVIDAELSYWSAWLAEREARATLDEATGTNISGVPNAPSGSDPNAVRGGAR